MYASSRLVQIGLGDWSGGQNTIALEENHVFVGDCFFLL